MAAVIIVRALLAVAPLRCTTTSVSTSLNAWRAAASEELLHYTVDAEPVDARSARISHYASGLAFRDALGTANAANAACREGRLTLNGDTVTGARRVRMGDVLGLSLRVRSAVGSPSAGSGEHELRKSHAQLAAVCNLLAAPTQHAPALSVLYEDDVCAIVCKPAGVHTARWQGTDRAGAVPLEGVLPLILAPPAAQPDALAAPFPVHRLDARVAGPVVVAKTRSARVALGRAFEVPGIVSKEYRALLVAPSPLGTSREASALVDAGALRRPAGADGLWQLRHDVEGRDAITDLHELARTPCAVDGALADASLFPRTGRRHQLRRACEALGAPILGDDLYSARAVVRRGIGLYLYCKRVTLPHPTDPDRGTISAEIDEPPRFGRLRAKAQSGWEWQQARDQCQQGADTHRPTGVL